MIAESPRPSVLLTRRIPSSVLARLEAVCNVEVPEGSRALDEPELARRVAGKQGLISVLTDPVTSAVLDAGTTLAVVANIAVGFNNIDVAHARRRGIVVTNTPDVLTEATAELTWALILTAVRRLSEGERIVRRGQWRGWTLEFLLGMELRGKQLGVIGRGRIGRAVAAKAPAFGMRAVFAARSGRSTVSDELSLDELLVSSDVITLHTPLTQDTRHLIDRRALARMKRSAFLVNTSRGPVVDEEALAWALRERLIAGAALDVYEREPEIVPELLAMENVVLAPHLGSATRETRTAMIDLAVNNVLAVLQGRPPLTPV
ncbi:MAG TPA: D-glycerate dehydrogenase [Vicinamibacterales bacterium]|nr:D-glycerate dehydrogenase [Vicinamibacterales bacterium]